MLFFYMKRLDLRKLYDCRRLLFVFKLRHLQHDDIINSLLPFYMIADDIYSLHFIYDICDTMSVTAIKRSVCTVFAECVMISCNIFSFNCWCSYYCCCKCLPGVANKLHNNPTIHLPNNVILSPVDSARNLGVIFDTNLYM